ncbi:MAG TPA: carbonic anhydrase [Tepidiformaceae bacterium]
MDAIDELLEQNDAYAAQFASGGRGAAPKKQLAIVCCMDSRIHLEAALGLEIGDAHMIRNAGGRVADALRSLAISQTLLGTNEVAIIHHTDCGMVMFTDESIRRKLREERGVEAEDVEFLPFTDLEQSVRDDIEVYRRSPLVRHDIPVRGFIYDVDSGRLSEVA